MAGFPNPRMNNSNCDESIYMDMSGPTYEQMISPDAEDEPIYQDMSGPTYEQMISPDSYEPIYQDMSGPTYEQMSCPDAQNEPIYQDMRGPTYEQMISPDAMDEPIYEEIGPHSYFDDIPPELPPRNRPLRKPRNPARYVRKRLNEEIGCVKKAFNSYWSSGLPITMANVDQSHSDSWRGDVIVIQ
ncbi:hypothetical protein GE061_019196 [Apolygus lucorum]|uniref:Uncharacterized protein n=1 Tax=Apolygus lucorum TaxID=248454 RepID=A0A6A4J7F2_APOLU|nr:hypothetical protein GE061_019196 [Apolygus lucorum]